MALDFRALGYESLVINSIAAALGSPPTGAKSFKGRIEESQIRFRSNDGFDPTAFEGELREIGEPILLGESDFDTKFVRTGTNDGALKGHWYNVEPGAFSTGYLPGITQQATIGVVGDNSVLLAILAEICATRTEARTGLPVATSNLLD